MSFQLVAGPAGSGKTTYLKKSVVRELLEKGEKPSGGQAPSILVLVPDQATFLMEQELLREIVAASGSRGFMRLHVLSFRRLCLRVLDEVGGLQYPFITPVGKSMAIQAILWKRRGDLTVFGSMVSYPGFRETVVRTISELLAYEVSPASMIEALSDGRMPSLLRKVQDLAIIYDEYQAFLKDRFFDPDDLFKLGAQSMSSSSLVQGASVWIDGFSGFTPNEYRVLRALLRCASRVTMALCIDRRTAESAPSDTSVFGPTRDTLERVRKIVKELGVPEEEPIFLPVSGEEGNSRAVQGEGDESCRGERQDVCGERKGTWGDGPYLPRFARARELGFLERALREHGKTQKFAGPRCGAVTVVSAASPRAEAEYVAREILRLVRDEGYRFRDITVEARDLSRYSDTLPQVFADYGIPFFLDQRRSISHHPLCELVRAALDVAITRFNSSAVLRYLKTDLVPVDRHQVDILENYVLAHGITGERWICGEPWQYGRKYLTDDEEPSDMERAGQLSQICDSIRRQAVYHLSEFCRRLSAKTVSAKDVSMAIYDLLVDLDVPRKLQEWYDECQARGDLLGAMEHAGVWDSVTEILQQASEILGSQEQDLRTYAVLISAGLDDIRLGVIPPSLDQVLIGSLERSRQPEVRATFLLGALLGEFPKRHQEDTVFSDREREYLKDAGIELDVTARVRQLRERYLVYVALTRPSERLYISYPLGDEEGKALSPSYVVTAVQEMLSIERAVFAADEPRPGDDDLDWLVPSRVAGMVARRLNAARHGGQLSPAWIEAYRWLVSEATGTVSSRASVILSSLSYTNRQDKLSRPIVRKLYGTSLVTSVSRMERFRACPFRHFLEDGLGLRERETFKIEPHDTGTILHRAMKVFAETFVPAFWGQGGRAPGLQQVQDLPSTPGGTIPGESVSGTSISGGSTSGGGKGEVPDVVSQALATMDRVADELLSEVQGEIFWSSGRYRHFGRATRRILRRAAQVFAEHLSRGQFRPLALEARFGDQGGLPPLRIEISPKEQVLIRGQIDRVDVAVLDDVAYVRIVDYKSSLRRLSPLEVYHGLSLQLLVYLAAVLNGWEELLKRAAAPARDGDTPGRSAESAGGVSWLSGMGLMASRRVMPAGALYAPLVDPVVPANEPGDQKALARARRKLRLSGLVVNDGRVLRMMDSWAQRWSDLIPVQFTSSGVSSRDALGPDDLSAVVDHVKKKVADIASEIYSGCIDIRPFRQGTRRACQTCPFSPVCGFDILVEGNSYWHVRNVSDARTWEIFRR